MPDGLPAITPGSPVHHLWPSDRRGYAGRKSGKWKFDPARSGSNSGRNIHIHLGR